MTLVESKALQGEPLTIKIWLGQLQSSPIAGTISPQSGTHNKEPSPKKQQKA
jgi:hypothetical protein